MIIAYTTHTYVLFLWGLSPSKTRLIHETTDVVAWYFPPPSATFVSPWICVSFLPLLSSLFVQSSWPPTSTRTCLVSFQALSLIIQIGNTTVLRNLTRFHSLPASFSGITGHVARLHTCKLFHKCQDHHLYTFLIGGELGSYPARYLKPVLSGCPFKRSYIAFTDAFQRRANLAIGA